MSEAPGFTRVEPVRLYQRIVEQVETAITDGTLQPGERLPSERELVAQFGASRPTVREALRVLESDGLVRSRPGDPLGPEVLPFSPDVLTKQVRRLTRAEALTATDLLAFRMILDGSASLLAARLRTPEQLLGLEATIDDMARAIEEDPDRFDEADVAFHDAVARVSGNALLQVCNGVVRGVVRSMISEKVARADDRDALMRRSLRHHREVLEAIRAGDGAGAAALSRRHLHDYYVDHVPAADRAALTALLTDDLGGG